jgi:CTP:molybdopterin cytidylyltransferase MocA
VIVDEIDDGFGRGGGHGVSTEGRNGGACQSVGDFGARYLIGSYAEAVVEVPLTGDAALVDVDTPESLSAVKAEIERA